MNFKKIALPLMLSLSFLFVACQDSTDTPNADTEVEESVEDAGDAVEDAGDDAEDAIEDAGDAVEDATN